MITDYFINIWKKLTEEGKEIDALVVRDNKWYGWKPDLPDIRDFKFSIHPSILEALPSSVDLRNNRIPILDQGQLGSCTANCISTAHYFDQIRQGAKTPIIPSRLFIYYNERVIEGDTQKDSGAMIRDGIKTIAKLGVCSETSWPYIISKFKNKPSSKCYKEALKHLSIQYRSVTQDINQLKGCLASGYPFVFGFSVYESFESAEVAKTGIVNLPQSGEKMLGGHAVICVGFSNDTQRFLVQNSWSSDWGQKGFFTIPYSYLTNKNLASDFWVVSVVET